MSETDKAKIEALEYVVALCRSSEQSTFYSEAYRGAFRDLRVRVEASIERVKSGERMESTNDLMKHKLLASNRDKFAEIYTQKLAEAIKRAPDEYAYGPAEIPDVVAKMIAAFVAGDARFEGAAKATAKALGIKPTLAAVKSFLCSQVSE